MIDPAELARLTETSSATVTAPPGAHGAVVAGIATEHPVLAITAGSRAADDLAAELRFWAPDRAVVVLPAWETLPHERLSPSPDIVGHRLAVLHRLQHPEPGDPAWGPIDILVAPVRALMQPVAAEAALAPPIELAAGGEIDPGALAARLVGFGYERCDLVERRGQFAVRGGIVDLFPPTLQHPVRIELWGDTIEEIRSFAVTDQRSLGVLTGTVRVVPCRELLLTDEVRHRAAEQAPRHAESRNELLQIAEGMVIPGMEALAPLVAARMIPLTELLPPGTVPVLVEPHRITARSDEAMRTAQEFAAAAWSAAGMGADTPMTPGREILLPWDRLHDGLGDRGVRTVTSLRAAADDDGEPDLAPIGPFASPAEAYADIAHRVTSGWAVTLVAAGPGPADRAAEVLAESDVPSSRAADPPGPGVVHIRVGHLGEGFQVRPARVAVFSDADLARRTARRSGDRVKMPSRRRRQVDPLSLKPGDFIVHEKHGVGRYVEMIHRDVRGADREYLVVEYAPSKRGHPPDRLFIPTDQLHAVTRYVGGEQPKPNKLGGADWAKAKGRARKAVREIAGELVRLYAARQSAAGFAFSPDSPWQRELEDAFEYVETADQMACIDEVKADMEKPMPMDRLICGDVGYGKTEIAVRAAFKAVQDGKQVAVLVPTTLLVQQHLQTFTERFAGFPVRVAALSRFQSDKEAAEVVRQLGEGTVDVVIGTHRLLTPNVRFKDLGLVIVDEEQRFGVEHKEYLKALRANVDMLAMSATPIPRTLEMAITGIREMSTIATPPEERLPVLTYVGPYDEKQIAAAIHRELLRDGQIFFVHNRVDSIGRVAARIAEIVPEARVAVAHGQMPEAALEQVVVDFWEGTIDVLVCTTIVESGIDIANANTLIIDRAESFGLSQLHQLRGRVGRSRSRAYAYFMHSPDRVLSETAHERLSTVAQNTDLGSGMQVALKDLEIRGAGNLLGGEQSGHIADVGFDLYVRLVGEALSEFKGEKPDEAGEIRIDLPLDAHVPAEYVPEERLRLEAYRRLAAARSGADIDDLVAELVDRYGPMPDVVRNMVAVARFRLVLARAGVDEVILMGNRLRLHPVELPDSRRVRLTRLYPGALLKPAVRQLLVPFPVSGRELLEGPDALDWTERLVKTVILDEPVEDPRGDR